MASSVEESAKHINNMELTAARKVYGLGKVCHMSSHLSFFNIYFIYDLFIWLCQALPEACMIFSCIMWDIVPWPGIKLRPPVLGTQSPSHCITREVPLTFFLFQKKCQSLMWKEMIRPVRTMWLYKIVSWSKHLNGLSWLPAGLCLMAESLDHTGATFPESPGLVVVFRLEL